MTELTREQASVLGEARAWRKSYPGPPVSWPQGRRLAIAVDVLEAANPAAENLEGLPHSTFMGRAIEEWFEIVHWLEGRCSKSGTLVEMAERVFAYETSLRRAGGTPPITEARVREIVQQELATERSPRTLADAVRPKPSTENFARGGIVGPEKCAWPAGTWKEPRPSMPMSAEDRAVSFIVKRVPIAARDAPGFDLRFRNALAEEFREAEAAAWERAIQAVIERATPTQRPMDRSYGEAVDDFLRGIHRLKGRCDPKALAT